MKKLLVLCVTVVMLFAMSMTAFAAKSDFLGSPSNNKAPEVIETTDGNGNEVEDVIVIPYGDRENLSAEEKSKIEEAYQTIVDAENITDLNDDLKDIVDNLGIDDEDLSVSDLFNVDHPNDGTYTVTLKPETANNFVALMEYVNGKWVIVEGVTFDKKTNRLTFKVNNSGNYAIVVDTSKATVAPQTGDASNIAVIVMVISAISLVGVILVSKKREA